MSHEVKSTPSLSYVTKAADAMVHGAAKGDRVAVRSDTFGYGLDEAPIAVASVRLPLDLHRSEWFHFSRSVVEAMLAALDKAEHKRRRR